MKLEKKTFIFENCEEIEIDGKYVGDFLVDDITTSIGRFACNYIGEEQTANYFHIEISSLANTVYAPFGFEGKAGESKFDRLLAYNDITQIEFEISTPITPETCGSKKYNYNVLWSNDKEDVNTYQKTVLSSLGNLYIVIGKDVEFENIFPSDTINDKEYMDFHFDMYDVEYNKN